MRLRLNTTLRAALIAAITAVGFTLTQAQAFENATWTFEDSLEAQTNITGLTYTWAGSGSATYVDSGMEAGAEVGNYYLDADLGKAITMDDGQYIKLGSNAYWANGDGKLGVGNGASNSYTLMAWVNMDTIPDETYFFGTGDGNGSGLGFVLNGGKLDLLAKGKAHYNITGDLSLTTGTWYNLAVTYDNTSGTAVAYVNGEQKATLTGLSTKDFANPGGQCSYIGAASTNGAQDTFDGKMAEFKILSGALSQEDILTAAHLTSTSPTPIVDYTWAGDSTNYAWSDSVWNTGTTTGVEFVQNNNAIFTDAGHNVVSITSNVTAKAVTVGGQNYTFDIAGGSLTANTLTVTSDQLSLTGEGSVNAATIAAAGKIINIAEKVVLQGTGEATLAGKGTFALASGVASRGSINLGDSWEGVVAVSNVSFANNMSSLNNLRTSKSWVLAKGLSGWSNSINIQANLILENGDNGWAYGQDNGNNGQTLTFSGKIKGTGKMGRSNTVGSTQNYVFTGDISEWTGTFESRSVANHSTTFRVSGDATVVKAAITNATGNLYVEVQNNATFHGAITNASKMTLGGNATFNGNVSAAAVSIAADKTATFNGTTSITGLTQNTGASLVNSGALTLGGTVTFGGNAITNTGTIAKGTNLVFDLDGLTASESSGTYTYTLFTGSSAVDFQTMGLTTDNITLTGGTLGKNWTFGTDGTISYTMNPQKVWTGDYYAEWNNTDANWNGSTFENGDSALFNDDAGVMVAPGISASQIEVAAGGKQVILAPLEDGTLTSATVIIGDGSELVAGLSLDGVTNFSVGTGSLWTILEDVTQNLGAGTNNGTIYVSEGATARLTDASNSKDLLVGIEGTGDIELAVNTNVEGGTSEATKVSSKATGKLIIDQGVTLSVGRPAVSGGFQQRYVDLSSFSAVDLNGGTLQVHMNNLVLKNLTVGTANSNLNILDSENVNTPALTLQGTTTLNKDLTLTSSWKHQLVIEKLAGTGTLNLNGSNNSVVNIGTADGDSGTVGKISVQSDASNVTINGTLNITGDLQLKKGATNIAGNVTVGSNVDLSDGGKATGTLVVKSDAVLTTAGMWGTYSTQLDIEKGGTVNLAGMQIVGAEGGAAIGTEGENAQYSADSTDWYIYNADITATGDITVGNLVSSSTIDTGAYDVTLTNGDNWLLGATVGAEGSLSMAGGYLDGLITSEGTVTFTDALVVDGFDEQEGAEGRMDVNGTFTEGADGNGYEAKAADYITIVDGGDVVADNIAVTQGEDEAAVTYYLNNSGDALREGSGGVTDYRTYYLTSDSVAVSALNEATRVIDVTGGTVDVDSEYTGDIMVSGEGSITGEHATPSQVGIAVDSTANFVDGVADTTNGVYYQNDTDAPVTVENTGEDTIHFSIAEADAKVTADKIVSDSEVDVQVDNQVVVNTIATYGDGTLILSQVDTDTLANIYADMGGSVTLKNVTNATLENLAMNNNTVAVYTDGTSTTEGTVTITDTLIAGQGTLLANLTLVDNSTLDLSLVGGGMQALTLGSMLTFDLQDGLVNLDSETIAALNNLGNGESLDLIVAAQGTGLSYTGAQTGMWYNDLFNRVDGLVGDYTVYANEGAFGLTKFSQVPEPTTGTLSLLALAALAARRRRK